MDKSKCHRHMVLTWVQCYTRSWWVFYCCCLKKYVHLVHLLSGASIVDVFRPPRARSHLHLVGPGLPPVFLRSGSNHPGVFGTLCLAPWMASSSSRGAHTDRAGWIPIGPLVWLGYHCMVFLPSPMWELFLVGQITNIEVDITFIDPKLINGDP
jgi:hypothetical protein